MPKFRYPGCWSPSQDTEGTSSASCSSTPPRSDRRPRRTPPSRSCSSRHAPPAMRVSEWPGEAVFAPWVLHPLLSAGFRSPSRRAASSTTSAATADSAPHAQTVWVTEDSGTRMPAVHSDTRRRHWQGLKGIAGKPPAAVRRSRAKSVAANRPAPVSAPRRLKIVEGPRKIYRVAYE